MSEKQQQIDTAWKVSEGFDRVRGKINKKKANEKSSNDLKNFKNEPFQHKAKDINEAWSEYEVQQTKEKSKNEELTAKEIKEFMEEQYS